jgi:hypothetical protein
MRFLPIAAVLGAAFASSGSASERTLPVLVDRTDQVGLSFTHFTNEPVPKQWHAMTYGASVGDINRDGFLDVIISGGLGQNIALFMNDGSGHFDDQALAWGIDQTNVEGASLTLADFDRNGWLDVYVGTYAQRNYLYMNTGAGSFIENAIAAGVQLEPDAGGVQYNTFGATVGDYDLDGDLDLYTAQWGQYTHFGNKLFRNDGDAIFQDVTVAAGVYQDPEDFLAFTPVFQDMNGDRYPELLIVADFLTSKYLHNSTDGTFAMLVNGTCTDENGMGSTIADYDNDGDLDWFVTSIYDDDGHSEAGWGISGNRLYRNDGADQYTDVTDQADVRHGHWGWGADFADLNHDGLLDLAMTNGMVFPSDRFPDETFITDPSRLWLNTGNFQEGPTFVEVALEAGLDHTAQGRTLVTFDADHDGDLDILITTNRGDVAFYRNETDLGDDTWLQIDLVAPPGNAAAGIGATVRVQVGGETLTRVTNTGSSYMGHGPARLHFGFSPRQTVDRIKILWPDGSETLMENVATGQIVLGRRGNLNGDDAIDALDLLAFLFSWGQCPSAPAVCPSDLNGDGVPNTTDLLIMLGNWG